MNVPTELGRFSLRRRIGEGGFGVVFDAFDNLYQCRVAVKVLRRAQVADVQGFKQEFRSLAGLLHPNLVQLYELANESDQWFFAMEYVDGSTFLEHVWNRRAAPPATATAADDAPSARAQQRPSIDAPRLRDAFRQLALAVSALHAARKLHCDLKPSNVIVTPEGRVVVLDFGLVTDFDGEASAASPHSAIGTPGYMAPEQAAREAVVPASDWYSVGVMLHEALFGGLPAEGVSYAPLPPDLEDLRRLSAEMLAVDPLRRPTDLDILRLIGAGQQPAPFAPLQRGFFGRGAELARLHAAWTRVDDGAAAMVRVIGASGMGKTALLRRFLEELREREPEVLVLAGRCYEQESVPYKALDSAMDDLCRYLLGLWRQERARVLPDDASRLARLFPAFEPIATGSAPDDVDAAGSHAQRRQAFLALRALFARLTIDRPLVLLLEDLHWGDVDSALLLAELLRGPTSPRVLVIASQRPSGHQFSDVLAEALPGLDTDAIDLHELPRDDARQMAVEILGPDRALFADTIASESSGHPIFIQQLAHRALAGRQPASALNSLGDVIMARINDLDASARTLLETLAIAGQPMAELVALEVARLDGATARHATSTVRNARLAISGTDSMLELTHDRVREAIVAATPAAETRRVHARIAAAIVAQPKPDPETLVRHYEGAGDDIHTRQFALLAAERAENAYAFDRAAQHYALILRLTEDSAPKRWEVLRQRAEALANAGRGGEAGDTFDEAAKALAAHNPDRIEIVALSRRAGEHALRSGRLDVGASRMAAVLKRVGVSMPGSRTAANALATVRRLRLFARGTHPNLGGAKSRDETQIARLDALWGASSSISMLNYVTADALGLDHLLRALDIGAPSHVIRGLGYEAAFEAVIGGRFFRRRSEKLLEQMDALVSTSEDPYDHAWARMAKGITSWLRGDWHSSWSHCTRAAELFREGCRGVTWELAICDSYLLPSLIYLGQMSRLGVLVPDALNGARERGDLFAAATLRMGQLGVLALAADRPQQAVDEATAAIGTFSRDIYLLPHYHHLLAVAQAALYRGDAYEAWKLIEQDWSAMKGAKLLMAQCLRVEIRHLRARAQIALAAGGKTVDGFTPDRLRRAAMTEAAAIAKDDVGPAAPLAAAIRSAVALAEHRKEDAERLLSEALVGFDAGQMHLYAHAARARLGTIRGGAEGATLRVEADAWMSKTGIENPPAMVEMLLPGFG